jgi:hypothetical protein
MCRRFFPLIFVFLLGTVLPGAADAQDVTPIIHRINEHGADKVVTNQNHASDPKAPVEFLTPGATTSVSKPLTYHGGPLMGTPVIYLIWYGNWNQANGSDTPDGQKIIRDFAKHVGDSPYFQLNSTLSMGGFGITGSVLFGGETSDAYSQGRKLSNLAVLAVVSTAIDNRSLPFDTNGVYFVLTSTDVRESTGFCKKFCGWHTSAPIAGGDIKIAFVGNANRCLSSCAPQSVGPNGNAGVDGMVSIIAHKLSESTTDPDPLSGWADRKGAENGDKCAWTFGSNQFQVASGAFANITLGNRNYLIQRILNKTGSGQFCMMSSTQN